MHNKSKDFDCVEMMHAGAQKIREETKNMTRQQELDYWKAKMEQLCWPTTQNANDSTTKPRTEKAREGVVPL